MENETKNNENIEKNNVFKLFEGGKSNNEAMALELANKLVQMQIDFLTETIKHVDEVLEKHKANFSSEEERKKFHVDVLLSSLLAPCGMLCEKILPSEAVAKLGVTDSVVQIIKLPVKTLFKLTKTYVEHRPTVQ